MWSWNRDYARSRLNQAPSPKARQALDLDGGN
jgi:hypothetical protein